MKEFKIERTTTIGGLIDNVEMSNRLKKSLELLCYKRIIFLKQLSVVTLFKQRKFGIKLIRELISIYPDLKNETGIISIEVLKNYLTNEKTKRL